MFKELGTIFESFFSDLPLWHLINVRGCDVWNVSFAWKYKLKPLSKLSSGKFDLTEKAHLCSNSMIFTENFYEKDLLWYLTENYWG